MRKFHKIQTGLLLAAILFTAAACNKKDDSLSAYGDVIFLKRLDGAYPVYGVSYHVQGNKALSEASVMLPYGSVKLTQNPTSTYLFENEPDDDDFTTSEPMDGDYIFNVVSESGEQLSIWEQQKFDNISFAEIDSMGFNDDENKMWLGMKWEKVDDADVYIVTLHKLSGETVFNGLRLDATKGNEFVISYHIQPLGVWNEAPKKGTRYNLKITAMTMDEDAIDDMDIWNIQETSEYVQEITWDLD